MQAMTFKNDYLVIGAYPNKGSFRNDDNEIVAYDHCKFYVQMPLKQGKGYSCVEFKFGSSDDFDKVFSVDLPAQATVEFEQVTTGKGRVQTNIVGIEFKKAKVV